jgi:hypothetical protein
VGQIALQDYLRQIEGLLEDNRLEEGAAHCYSILRQQPRHVATYRLFGRTLLEQQQYHHSIDIFQRVLSADPEDLFAHAGLAEAYRATDDLPRSIWHMERAFEIQPYNRVVQLEMRELYQQRDGFAPEQVSLTRAALARIYVRGCHYRLATHELQALLVDQPDRIDLRVLLAEALFWDDRRVAAAQLCGDIVEKLADCIKPNAILAEMWTSGGREPEARPYIERLWALTLLDVSERNPETLIGRALSRAEFALLPDQVFVERLEFVPDSIGEPAVIPEPRSAFPAVAVQELPGWLDDLDEELAKESAFESDQPAEEEEEADWAVPFLAGRENVDLPETAALADTIALENVQSDPAESSFEETSGQELIEERALPDTAESISADAALLLESDADDEAELQSKAGVSGVLGIDDASEDEPIGPAETLVGEHKVAQEEMPAGEPEQPIRAFRSEKAAAESFEEEDAQLSRGDRVVEDDSPAQESEPAESVLPQEDLYLESIVAEAFGEIEPSELPERESGELIWDEDGPSTDLLFAALGARKAEHTLQEDQRESAITEGDEEIGRRTRPDASDHELDLSAEEPGELHEMAPESVESEDEADIIDPANVVTKEFDGPPRTMDDSAEPVAGEVVSAPEELTPTWPESRTPDVAFEQSGPTREEAPLFEPPATEEVVDSPDVGPPVAFPSDDSFDTGDSGDVGDPSDWLDDLSEDTTDVENLPDWLYDAIGFTGELDMPDDYEEPEWLEELGLDKDGPARENRPMTSEDVAHENSGEAHESVRGRAESAATAGYKSRDDNMIPDWLQDAGGSLEELPSDLVEDSSIYESALNDEDDDGLSWLEELAAEDTDKDAEDGVTKADAFDRLTRNQTGDPDEQMDSD